AEDSGKCKQNDPDGHQRATCPAKHRGKGGDGKGRSLVSGSGGRVHLSEHSGTGDDQTCNGTYHQSIPEGSSHIDITLTYRMVGRGCRRRDGGGTHARFIGKNAPGHSIAESSP